MVYQVDVMAVLISLSALRLNWNFDSLLLMLCDHYRLRMMHDCIYADDRLAYACRSFFSFIPSPSFTILTIARVDSWFYKHIPLNSAFI